MIVSISPEDIENGGKILDIIIQIIKWLGGTVVAAWIAVRWTLKQGVIVGEEKQRYENIVEIVEKLKALDLDSLIKTVAELKKDSPMWLTKTEHDGIQRICQGDIERMIDSRMYKAVLEWRDELASINANVCHIMGALNLRPVDQGKRRRQTDVNDA